MYFILDNADLVLSKKDEDHPTNGPIFPCSEVMGRKPAIFIRPPQKDAPFFPLRSVSGLIHYDGMYYRDFSVSNAITDDDMRRIVPFNPQKTGCSLNNGNGMRLGSVSLNIAYTVDLNNMNMVDFAKEYLWDCLCDDALDGFHASMDHLEVIENPSAHEDDIPEDFRSIPSSNE